MKRFISTFLTFLAAVTLPAQQYYFTVDERQPADRPLLQGAQRILVVNNTVPQPEEFGHSNAEDGTMLAGTSVDLTDAALRCLFAATQTMDGSGEYLQVELMDISQNKSRNFYSRSPMTVVDEEQLCAEYEADALLILNHLVLYDMCESFPVDADRYYAYLQACSQTHWTVHHAGKPQDAVFTTADTLLWEVEPVYSRTSALAGLPDRHDALLYLAQQAGTNVAVSLTPQWLPATHYLYDNPDADIQRGMRAFQRKLWQDAIAAWQQALDKGDKKVSAIAAADMAVAAEMSGDYSAALDYANRAAGLFGAWKNTDGRQQQVNMRHYVEHLQQRQADESALSVR